MISEKKSLFSRCTEPLLIFLVLYFPTILQQQVGEGIIDFDNPFLYLTYFAVAFPRLLFLLWLIDRQQKTSFAEFGFRKPQTPIDWLMPAVVLASLFAVQAAASALLSFFDSEAFSAARHIPFSITRINMLFPALLLFLLTAYTEEIFFRSYLLTYQLRNGVPAAVALLVSAFLFASGHLYQGWTATATVFLVGLILGAWFLALKNIHLLAISHTFFNFFQLLFLFFIRSASGL